MLLGNYRVCDGLDDCDGEVDNGFVELGEVCTVIAGACAEEGTLSVMIVKME